VRSELSLGASRRRGRGPCRRPGSGGGAGTRAGWARTRTAARCRRGGKRATKRLKGRSAAARLVASQQRRRPEAPSPPGTIRGSADNSPQIRAGFRVRARWRWRGSIGSRREGTSGQGGWLMRRSSGISRGLCKSGGSLQENTGDRRGKTIWSGRRSMYRTGKVGDAGHCSASRSTGMRMRIGRDGSREGENSSILSFFFVSGPMV
jgi:hypothetical protein